MFYASILVIFLAISISIELIFHERLFHSLKERILFALIFTTMGALWDLFGITQGHWTFPKSGILGIYMGVIPIEEFFWFLIVPYFCLTIYRAVHTKSDLSK